VAIPGRERPVKLIHLDTVILRAIIDEDDELYHQARHLVNDGKYGPFGASILAVGESFALIAEDCESHRLNESSNQLRSLIKKKKIVIRGNGPGDECFSMAKEIMRIDSYIKPTDALITSIMMLDDQSMGLYTTDKILLINENLKSMVSDKRKWIRSPID
jgi:hypothetical protein